MKKTTYQITKKTFLPQTDNYTLAIGNRPIHSYKNCHFVTKSFPAASLKYKSFGDETPTKIKYKSLILLTLLIMQLAPIHSAEAGWVEAGRGVAKRLCFWCKKDGESFLDSRKMKVTNTSAVSENITKSGRKFMDEYCEDLTAKVLRGELDNYVIGREEEFRHLIEVLNRGGKNTNKNPLIYGDSGVGKTTLIDKLAYNMAKHPEKLPRTLRGKRLVKLDVKSFTAGTGNRGDAENRVKALTHFLSENSDIILFVDEIQDLAPKKSDEYNYLKNMLPILLGDVKGASFNQDFRFIGTTMTNSLDEIMNIEGMARRFTKILFREPNFLQTMTILEPELLKIQERHGIRIPLHVLETAIEVAKKHILEVRAPDNVKQLLWSIASSHETSRLYKPKALTDLETSLGEKGLLLKSLANKTGPFYQLKEIRLKKEVDSLKQKYQTLQGQWEEIADEFSKTQEVISDIQEYSAYLQRLLDQVGQNRSIPAERLLQTAENLQKLAKAFPTQYMSEVDALAKNLSQLSPTHPQALADIQELMEILEKDIAFRREVIVGKTPFGLFDEINEEDVYKYVAEKTNKPIEMVRLGDPEKEVNGGLAGLVDRTLREKVVGQEQAIQALVNQIKAFQRGLLPDTEPLGHFLFLGPSRLGKTYMPQVLGEVFGEGGYLRLPMSDYKNAHDITRLTGAPPSFVGFDSKVDLNERVRKNPHLVICVDEVDRAHPDVIEFFMKLREQGVHKDQQGREVDFRGVTFVYTSNATENIDTQILNRITEPKKRRAFLEVLLRKEKPEKFQEAFLNGMTDIIRFDHFTEKGKILVTDKIWNKWRKMINRMANIDVILKPEVVEYLAANSEGGNAAKVTQIIRSEIISPIKEMSYKRGDLIDIELNTSGGVHDSPFTINVREVLRDLNGDELTDLLIERELSTDIHEVLERTPEDQLPVPMTLDEMDEAIKAEREKPTANNDMMRALEGLNRGGAGRSETLGEQGTSNNLIDLSGDVEAARRARETQTAPVQRRINE